LIFFAGLIRDSSMLTDYCILQHPDLLQLCIDTELGLYRHLVDKTLLTGSLHPLLSHSLLSNGSNLKHSGGHHLGPNIITNTSKENNSNSFSQQNDTISLAAAFYHNII